MKPLRTFKIIFSITTLMWFVVSSFSPVIAQDSGGTDLVNPIYAYKPFSSCAHPDTNNLTRCQQMEAAILASTVRLEMRQYAVNADGRAFLEDSGVSHATVIAGRYLITHNHFALTLADLQDGRRRELTIYSAAGEVILQDAPFESFTVVSAAPQSLVFDFGDYGGVGLFAAIGISSATIDLEAGRNLYPGIEVAQINWDGARATVDWVHVIDRTEQAGVEILVLDNFVERGASGGGIFWEGVHIANNWSRQSTVRGSGDVLRQYTVAALDTMDLMPGK